MSDELKDLQRKRRFWRNRALKEEEKGGPWLYVSVWSWLLEDMYARQIAALKKKARTK